MSNEDLSIEVEELITCNICHNIMKFPRMLLPCQHGYCLNCLADLVSSTSLTEKAVGGQYVGGGLVINADDPATLSIDCPDCRGMHKTQFVNDVPVHRLAKQLIEKFKPRECGKKIICKCSCKDEKEVLHECINCEKQYCKGCSKNKDFDNCKELQHCIANVADGENFLCFEHNINLKYYCSPCKRPICVDCFLKDHRGHENKRISKIGQDLKYDVVKCKSIADGNNEDLEALERDAENLKGTLEVNVIDCLETFEDNIHGIVSYLFDKAKEDELGQIEVRAVEIDLDLEKLGCQLNAGQTTGEINQLHEVLKEMEDHDPKILKFKDQISARLDSCNEQERKVKFVQRRFGNMKKQKGLFEISMKCAFESIRNWFPNLQANYAAEPKSFYRDYFKRKYLASLRTEQTDQSVKQSKEIDKGAKTTHLGETDRQPSQGAKEEKPGQVAAAKSQSSIVTDEKQSSTSPNMQDIIDQRGDSVRMRHPSTGSSGGTLPYYTAPHTPPDTPPHTRLGRKDTERAWSTSTLSELPYEDKVIQEQRSQSSYAINKMERFSSQDNATWQAPQSSRGRGATRRKASSFSDIMNDMREQRTPPTNYSQPRIPLNSSTSPSPSPPHQLRSHQPRASPPYQPSFHHSRSSPTSQPFVRYPAPQETHSAMAPATFNDAPASGGMGQRRNKVTIKDPNQGCKDVTDEILRRTYPNRK